MGDHDHVARRCPRGRRRRRDQRRKVVSRLHLRQIPSSATAPTALMPGCALSWLSMPARVGGAAVRCGERVLQERSRSSGVSTSSASEATSTTSGTRAARPGRCSTWRWRLPGPNAGVDHVGRREQQRVGAGAVAVGDDQRRAVARPGARAAILELLGVEQRTVAGDQQHPLGPGHSALAATPLAAATLWPWSCVVEHRRAVAAGDPLGAVVGGHDDDLVDRGGAPAARPARRRTSPRPGRGAVGRSSPLDRRCLASAKLLIGRIAAVASAANGIRSCASRAAGDVLRRRAPRTGASASATRRVSAGVLSEHVDLQQGHRLGAARRRPGRRSRRRRSPRSRPPDRGCPAHCMNAAVGPLSTWPATSGLTATTGALRVGERLADRPASPGSGRIEITGFDGPMTIGRRGRDRVE